MQKSCVIEFNLEGKGIEVTFAGEWIRADLDRVQVALFRELPKHIAKRREELKRKEKDNG